MIKLQIWDTAGQERFRAITKSYYHGSHGIVIVYDITDRKTFDKVRDWMEQIQQADVNEETCYCKILIGNKSDLSESREVSIQEGEQLAREYDIPFMETSAKDSLNVDNLFYTMATEMKDKAGVKTSQNTETNSSYQLKGTSVEGKKKCSC